METCCKSFLAMCLQYFVGKAFERPLQVVTSWPHPFASLTLWVPAWVPCGPAPRSHSTLATHGLQLDHRWLLWADWGCSGICGYSSGSTCIYLHTAVEKDCIEISRQSLFDANISSGFQCKPMLYANPLPRWKEVSLMMSVHKTRGCVRCHISALIKDMPYYRRKMYALCFSFFLFPFLSFLFLFLIITRFIVKMVLCDFSCQNPTRWHGGLSS